MKKYNVVIIGDSYIEKQKTDEMIKKIKERVENYEEVKKRLAWLKK